MVLAKISSIMHELILNLYVFKSWLLKFQTAKNIEMENVAPTGLWFFHILGFASLFFILFYHLQVKFVCTFCENAFHFNNKLNQLDLCRKSRREEC